MGEILNIFFAIATIDRRIANLWGRLSGLKG